MDAISKLLTRLADAPVDDWGHKRGLYLCSCGTKKIIDDGNVRRGKTQSCGCFNRMRHRDRTNWGKGKKKKKEVQKKKLIKIYESYSSKGIKEGRSKYVTEKELELIYWGLIPDPFEF